MTQLAFQPHIDTGHKARRSPALALGLLLAAVALQGLHFAEHVAQVIQLFFLRLPVAARDEREAEAVEVISR